MQEITISYMSLRDLKEVCDIERSVFPDPWSYHMFEDELRLPELYNLLAVRLHGELVAYGGILTIHDESHITNLAVKPIFQSKGIGKILLKELIKLAIAKDTKNLSLEVRTDNVIAQKLYKKFNFSTIAIRKHYYGYDEDALIMSIENINESSYIKAIESANGSTSFKVTSYVKDRNKDLGS